MNKTDFPSEAFLSFRFVWGFGRLEEKRDLMMVVRNTIIPKQPSEKAQGLNYEKLDEFPFRSLSFKFSVVWGFGRFEEKIRCKVIILEKTFRILVKRISLWEASESERMKNDLWRRELLSYI